MRKLLFIALGSILTVSVTGQTVFGSDSLRADSSVFFKEVCYTIHGSDSLMLDWYPGEDSIPGPTLLFVHGGGFYTGAHRNPGIVYFCDSMRNLGFQVASMGYRLHLKGQDFHCDQPVPNKIKAVDTAADDIITALGFLEASQAELQLDMDRIALVGSSAGAEAVLQAMYAPRDVSASVFGIDALVSLAGAIADTTWITPTNAVPTQFFHGTCDPLVPFASDIHHYCPKKSPGAWFLHGSWTLHAQLEGMGISSYLHIACGEGHRMSGSPMQDNIPDIARFLWQVMVLNDEVHTVVVSPGENNCRYYKCELCE